MADFEVNRRLKKLITEVYKTTPHKFSSRYSDTGGVKTSQVLRERNGLSNKLLENILLAYPEINRTWLLTGEGEMLIQKDKEYTIPESEKNIAAEPPENYIDNQTRLIRMQEQLLENNTRLMAGQEKLIETNNMLAAQIIDLCSKNQQNAVLEKLEAFSKEFQEFRSESKNAPAREDVGCADVG